MSSLVGSSLTVLDQFELWAMSKRSSLLQKANSIPLSIDDKRSFICKEIGRLGQDFKKGALHQTTDIIKSVAIVAITPFAILGEMFRYSRGSIKATTCLKNIGLAPVVLISSVFGTIFGGLGAINKGVSASATGVGLLVWHGGEALVRLIKQPGADTVLSDKPRVRDIVYHAVGITLLAAGAVFVPVAAIQLLALPIILGSVYGIINNQFTVRECPEYYTMGHYYDGVELGGHAIKTNNLLIKPIVTGCYATVGVTKLAGIILSAAGTLPYAASALPVPLAAAMIGGVSAIGLIAGHVFSRMKSKSIQNDLEAFADLLKIKWSDADKEMTWDHFADMQRPKIEEIRQQLAETDSNELEIFNAKLKKLMIRISSYDLEDDKPIKYMIGWQANNTRNLTGYVFAGGGIIAVAVATLFLRV